MKEYKIESITLSKPKYPLNEKDEQFILERLHEMDEEIEKAEDLQEKLYHKATKYGFVRGLIAFGYNAVEIGGDEDF